MTGDRASEARRADRLDALRGAAVLWMATFHLGFDLNHFGFLQPRQNVYLDPFWTVQRTCIVSLFLFCAGVGQALAAQQSAGWPRFWRRWGQVAGCAVLVSLGSWWMFPRSWISFGVLHALAVMLVAARLCGRWTTRPAFPLGMVVLGAVAIALPAFVQHPFFDTRWTNPWGLVTRKPVTEDYVPLLPWWGVLCWGMAAGAWCVARRPAWVWGALQRPLQPLAVLGRYSLSFYMLHQPVFVGVLMAATMGR